MSGNVKAINNRSITFKLIVSFKPATCSFLFLNISIHNTAAINGPNEFRENTNDLNPDAF